MRIYLKIAGKFNLSYEIDEITSKYYLLNNDLNQLDGFLNGLMRKYQGEINNKNSLTSGNSVGSG